MATVEQPRTASPRVVVVTGTPSGFGALTAKALARAGHIVYAGMRATADRNAPFVAEMEVGDDLSHAVLHRAGRGQLGE